MSMCTLHSKRLQFGRYRLYFPMYRFFQPLLFACSLSNANASKKLTGNTTLTH